MTEASSRAQVKAAYLVLLCAILFLNPTYSFATPQPPEQQPEQQPEQPPEQPPLLNHLEALNCAKDEEQALAALTTLKSNSSPEFNVPNEWIGTTKRPQLHAATFDFTIETLLGSIEKFPALTSKAESILLGWNYCSVYHNGKYFDLLLNKGRLQRTIAGYGDKWHGFAQLGISNKGHDRYIPIAFANTDRSMRQQLVYNWWEIQRKQCLPHPGTGELFYKKTLYGPSKVSVKKHSVNPIYPYTLNSSCAAAIPTKQVTPQPTTYQQQLIQTAFEHQKREWQFYHLSLQTLADSEQVTPDKDTDKSSTTVHTEAPAPNQNHIANKTARPSTPQVFLLEEPPLASAIDTTLRHNSENHQSTAPQSASGSFSNGSVPAFSKQPLSPRDRKYHEFSGSFALNNKGLEDTWSFTANLGYKPIRASYYFARTGFTWSKDDSDSPSYYWGIGYEDWHTGTWGFELNNWGPLKPGDGLGLEKAIASVNYKFASTLLSDNNVSSSLSLSTGKGALPAATLAGSWSPKPNWFVRTLVTQPLMGGATTWTYGFGYNDWRLKTWALEYNNWGRNHALDPNFKKNGLVTLSWKWGF